MITQIDSFELERALQTLDSDVEAAESHGLLCGCLCAAADFDVQRWLAHLMLSDETSSESDMARSVLHELAHQTLIAFDDTERLPELLGIDFEASMRERVAGVASWSRGFLCGFGLEGEPENSNISAERMEFLEDLEKVGRLDEELEDDEDNERSLYEVVEFIRVGAALLRAEICTFDAPTTGDSIH
ncbi:MAG: UPF0149 family protein [Pseudomonadota bacterium]